MIPESLADLGRQIGAWASGEPDELLDEWYDKYGNQNPNGDPKEILREGLKYQGNGGIIKAERNETFHCYGDYLRTVLGSALQNNPEEVDQIIAEVEQCGGTIRFLRNNTKMVCNIAFGIPGEIEVDDNISIAGLKHEFRHFMDDMENGNPGIGYYLRDQDVFFEFEKRGYEEELKIAESLGLNDIAESIRNEIEKRRREIYGEENDS